MASTQDLQILLRAKNDTDAAFRALQQNIEGTRAASQQAAGGFGEMAKGAMVLGAGIVGTQKALEVLGSTISGTIAAVRDMAVNFVESAGRLSDLAAKLDVSTTKLQEWQYAGSKVGVTGEEIANAAVRMSRAIAEPSTKVEAAIAGLGLSISRLQAMKPDEQFETVAAALQKVGDSGKQAALGADIMGRGFSSILPMIRSDMQGLEDEAHRVGAVMSEDMVAAGDNVGDSVTALNEAWTGFKNTLGAFLVENTDMVTFFKDLTTSVAALHREFKSGESGLLAWTVKLGGIGVAVQLMSRALQELNRNMAGSALSGGARKGSDLGSGLFGGMSAGNDIADAKKYEQLQQKMAAAAAKRRREEERDERAMWEMMKTVWAQGAAEFDKSLGEAYRKVQKQLKDLEDQNKATWDAWSKGLDEILRKQEEHNAQVEKNRQAVAALAGSFHQLGSIIGGTLGFGFDMLGTFLDGLLQMIEFTEEARSSWEKLALAAQTAASILQGPGGAKGALSGALQGGMAGFAIGGPIGAGIGAVAGGILGLFGGGKNKALEEARKQFEQLQASIVDTYGSLEEFRRLATGFGIDLSKAFDPAHPEQLKAAMDQLNKAMEEQRKQIELLGKANDILAERAKNFTAQLEKTKHVTDEQRASFKRMGDYAVAIFAGLFKQSGDLLGTLQQMGPTLDELTAAQRKYNLEAGRAFQDLARLNKWVKAHKELASDVSTLNQLTTTFADAQMLNGQILLDIGQDAVQSFQDLQRGGLDANQAMAMLHPTLQTLWEHQRRFHDITDEATLALLREAEANNQVGEQFMAVNEQILDVLLAIAEVLGATIPDYLRGLGDEAEETGRRMTKAFSGVRLPGGDGSPRNGGGPPRQHGERVPFRPGGQARTVAEHEAESIVTDDHLAAIVGRAIRMAGSEMGGSAGRGGGGAVHIYIDGKELDARVSKGIRRKQIRTTTGRRPGQGA